MVGALERAERVALALEAVLQALVRILDDHVQRSRRARLAHAARRTGRHVVAIARLDPVCDALGVAQAPGGRIPQRAALDVARAGRVAEQDALLGAVAGAILYGSSFTLRWASIRAEVYALAFLLQALALWRAVVALRTGTTRDAVRQAIQIEGVPLHLVDTAGLRETADEVERLGIARTWSAIERADVVVLIVDARAGVTAADEAIVAKLPARTGNEKYAIGEIAIADGSERRLRPGANAKVPTFNAVPGKVTLVGGVKVLDVGEGLSLLPDPSVTRARAVRVLARKDRRISSSLAKGKVGKVGEVEKMSWVAMPDSCARH